MPANRQLWPRRIRRIVQALAFLLFLVFIVVMPTLTVRHERADWLMRFSPFSGLGASISSWQLMRAFWPALVLLLAAVALGRFFCGWLCPLGTTLDVGDKVIRFFRGRRGGSGKREVQAQQTSPEFEHIRGRRFKYYLLAGCLFGAFLGISFFGFFDPLSIAVRSYVLVVHSYASQALGRSAAARSALMAQTQPVYQLHLFTFVVLAGLLALGLVRRRFWCRYVCPLGALYALAGKPAVTKRSATEACIECGRCADACPMSCISPDGRRTLNGECTLCLNCQAVCPTRAVRFLRATPAEQKQEVDLTRRGALAAVAAGAAAYPVFRLNPARKLAKTDPFIRPPLASRDMGAFLSKCLRCGQCMRACPTHVIQPAGFGAGIESLWTPKLVPRLGYCIYDCDACGRACPSGAIPPFTLEEKHRTAMGLAYVDTSRCIPWRGEQRRHETGFVADEHNCGVCEEVCPVPGKAIHFRRIYGSGNGGELRLPYVRPEACVGCGFCEAVCPVEGRAAIRITGGFRELPAPPPVAAAAPLTERALPERVGELRITGPKATYEGASRLYDYIDGGADPYFTFGFIRVSAAEYTDGSNNVKADLWQFKSTDDAFGTFAKDRRGDPVAVGDEGSMTGGSLWARRGHYMISIMDLGQTPPAQVRLLAAAALDALNEEEAPRPEICRELPREKLDSASVVFMRDEAPLLDLRLAENYIPDGTFGIVGGAVGAYGAYAPREARKRTGLLLVRHTSGQAAGDAVSRLAELRSGWGEEKVADEPYVIFKAADGDYCVTGSAGRYFAAAFSAPSAETGKELVADALSR